MPNLLFGSQDDPQSSRAANEKKTTSDQTAKDAGPQNPKDPRIKMGLTAGVFCLVLLTLAAIIFPVPHDHPQVQNAVSLSVQILAGLTLIVMLMAGLALIYFHASIANRDQALGLPEGSVRALLAFSLLLIFVIVAVFLFSNVNSSEMTQVSVHDKMSQTEIDYLKSQFTIISEPVIVGDQDKGKQCVQPALAQPTKSEGQAANSSVPTPKAFLTGPCDALLGTQAIDINGKPLYRATFYTKRNKDSDDFAKQIFTTLSGVFISVVSFYFGSSTASSGVATGVRATGKNDPGTDSSTTGKPKIPAPQPNDDVAIANQAAEAKKKAEEDAKKTKDEADKKAEEERNRREEAASLPINNEREAEDVATASGGETLSTIG